MTTFEVAPGIGLAGAIVFFLALWAWRSQESLLRWYVLIGAFTGAALWLWQVRGADQPLETYFDAVCVGIVGLGFSTMAVLGVKHLAEAWRDNDGGEILRGLAYIAGFGFMLLGRFFI